MTEKKVLREKFAAVRDSVSAESREVQQSEIFNAVVESAEYKKADCVFLYVSFGSEVSTRSLLDRALDDGKSVAVPLCDVKRHTMTVVLIDSMKCLKEGAYGIPEPDRGAVLRGELKTAEPEEIDLAVVPALAFDVEGNRLGYGGGYYDRFLESYQGVSLGLAFGECVCERLEVEAFDRPVSRVVYPKSF